VFSRFLRRRPVCRILFQQFHSQHKEASDHSDAQPIDLTRFSPEKIRNFGIIAHVDHGKSTLADRLLEFTGAIKESSENKQVLDKLQVERERGITVKAQSASVVYKHKNEDYLLNLIDTPGHVDFSYEVSRSLSACQGVILLVDATQGVQAQTLANFLLSMEHGLPVIPVINKIDSPRANVEKVEQEMLNVLDVPASEIIHISAKFGQNIEKVLEAIVELLPPPVCDEKSSYDSSALLKALLFDSTYEKFRGVIANVAILDGTLRKNDIISSVYLSQKDGNSKSFYEVKEVGLMRPEHVATNVLYAGQVGYIVCGMKTVADAQIGDTLFHHKQPVIGLPEFKKAKPVVFGEMFPSEQTQYKNLEAALNRLMLNDRSVTKTSSKSFLLGPGFRIGFLGLLHMDVFCQRLQQEFGANVVMTRPTVPYKAILKANKRLQLKDETEIVISTPDDYPDNGLVKEFLQPIITGTIISPARYSQSIIELCVSRNGSAVSNSYISDATVMLQYKLPLDEIVTDFYDRLKSISSGYASFDYEEAGFETVNLTKVDVLLNGELVREFSKICTLEKSRKLGVITCSKLKEMIPRQPFQVSIQAAIGKSIIARQNLPAVKKDVLAKCGGGDFSRKMKLLQREAENQKHLRAIGNIKVPKDLFVKMLRE
uniref:Translation factor GUF1 homolog, mitochondrial n=1 Tax=Ciona savignyi TaxID=51511 RepID=H2YQM6_CIOSA